MSTPAVLITGASSGIGAVYAERFALRGHDLVLVARDGARLNAAAERLRAAAGVKVDVLVADLTAEDALAAVERRLAEDADVGVLINNAGAALPGRFLDHSASRIDGLIRLNAIAPTRLARAAGERFAAAGEGAIVNIGSVVGLAPEYGSSVYGATKAFVLYLSQSLAGELGPRGVYVQAVLPAATRTEIWERAGRDPATIPGLMEVGDLVDAALVGFDRREAVTIPPLHDESRWGAMQAARGAMAQEFGQSEPAPRYMNVAG